MVSLKISALLVLLFLFSFFVWFQETGTSEESLLQLSISSPSEVTENSFFNINIEANSIPIDNVTVTFNKETNITDSQGIVGFQAPRILPQDNTTYTILAQKEGYTASSKNITILDIPQLYPIVENPAILEETMFVITVVDEQGNNVGNATITFEKKTYLTDSNGSVELLAPSTYKAEEVYVNVSKTGYIENTIQIIITPSPEIENIRGVLFFIYIFVGIAVVSLLLILIQYLKKRKINR